MFHEDPFELNFVHTGRCVDRPENGSIEGAHIVNFSSGRGSVEGLLCGEILVACHIATADAVNVVRPSFSERS